jgi:hypothetical protein
MLSPSVTAKEMGAKRPFNGHLQISPARIETTESVAAPSSLARLKLHLTAGPGNKICRSTFGQGVDACHWCAMPACRYGVDKNADGTWCVTDFREGRAAEMHGAYLYRLTSVDLARTCRPPKR